MNIFKKIVLYFLLGISLLFLSFFIYLQLNYYPPILMYHSIGPAPVDTPQISLEAFQQQMRYLKEENFKVVKLEELAELIKARKVPRGVVAITFDDGYKNNLEAVRILKELNLLHSQGDT